MLCCDGVPTAVACSNGYSALFLALTAARISPGSHVLVPSLTMCAVANSVLAAGAVPVFVDSAPGRLNPEMEQYLARRTANVSYVITTNTERQSYIGCPLNPLTRLFVFLLSL
jgi:perosamine synthetase